MFAYIPNNMWPAQFIIHSHNTVGARRMYEELIEKEQTVSIIPFTMESLVQISNMIRAS